MTDRDLEKLLCRGLSSSSRHKKLLRKRLFEENTELSVNDLGQVTGGVMEEIPEFEDWPDENDHVH